MTTFERHIRLIDKSRIQEILLYLVMWLLIILFPIMNESIEYSRGHDFDWKHIFHWWIASIPYLIIFFIHDIVLVPQFLLKGRFKRYAFLTLCILAAFYFSQRLTMDRDVFPAEQEECFHKPLPPAPGMHHQHAYGFPPPNDMPGNHPPRPHLPFPHLINLFIAFLMLGFNVAVSLLFKYYREMDTLEATENIRIKNELKYLKTQISPHFFMNMLNNIHAMIEKDPVKAQDLIIELSKIMRYVLYEGNHNKTTFADEVKFISSYIELMRQRYSAEKVSIELSVPESPSSLIQLPPLLFITFVENAFKHGISYYNNSVIKVSLEENNGNIHFWCFNTKPKANSESILEGGVGLKNVQRRLDLIYGNSYTLELKEDKDNYTVNLTIPCL
ncbi:MAG: sensor histidine kinase [Bacteroidales bacterium]|nr:sensor histidine kinase [Bacteroidales bacterium]